MTFLCLIILNGALGFDDWYLHLASNGISQKVQDKPFEVKRVSYDDIPGDGERLMQYKTEDLDISLNEAEIEQFSKRNHIGLNRRFGYEEIDKLVEIADAFPGLDGRILRSIEELRQTALNYQRRMAQMDEIRR